MPAEARERLSLPSPSSTGLVHEIAGKAMQGKYQNVRAYLAGPPPAVDASIRMLLLQAKLPADHIRYDKFS